MVERESRSGRGNQNLNRVDLPLQTLIFYIDNRELKREREALLIY